MLFCDIAQILAEMAAGERESGLTKTFTVKNIGLSPGDYRYSYCHKFPKNPGLYWYCAAASQRISPSRTLSRSEVIYVGVASDLANRITVKDHMHLADHGSPTPSHPKGMAKERTFPSGGFFVEHMSFHGPDALEFVRLGHVFVGWAELEAKDKVGSLSPDDLETIEGKILKEAKLVDGVLPLFNRRG